MHDAPIYAQLIRERGDIPLQTREEARRIQRELERVLNTDTGLPPRPGAPSAPALPPSGSNSGGGWFS